jgi:hypothetical protein
MPKEIDLTKLDTFTSAEFDTEVQKVINGLNKHGSSKNISVLCIVIGGDKEDDDKQHVRMISTMDDQHTLAVLMGMAARQQTMIADKQKAEEASQASQN